MSSTIPIDFLANNARVGGGEVMLVRRAVVARGLGMAVRVIGPGAGDLRDACERADVPFVAVRGRDRRAYAVALGAVTSRSRSLLWCGGLVPALATVAVPRRRIIDLHQVPTRHQARLLRVARRRSELVVVPSAFAARHVAGSVVLENWTDAPTPVLRRPDPGGSLRVGFLGRLGTTKGIGVLADALRELDARSPGRFRFVVAGDHRLVPRDDADLVRRQLDRCQGFITRLGWVAPDELLGTVDVLVVPSIADEAFGLVAAEAMAHRVPTVVTDAGALPEVVGPHHPWVVPRGDVAALMRAIESVRAEPEKVAAATAAGRHRWDERYSPDAGAARVERLLTDQGLTPG